MNQMTATPLQALDPRQYSSETSRPLPRRKLGGWTMALLIGLRVYVVLAIPVVVYAFIHAMGTGH